MVGKTIPSNVEYVNRMKENKSTTLWKINFFNKLNIKVIFRVNWLLDC